MKIREQVVGMATDQVAKFCRKSAAKKGVLGTILMGAGIVGLNLLLTAIQEQSFAAGFEDAERSNEAVFVKLHESGKITWGDMIKAADNAAKEAGLPPLNEENKPDITITQF